MRKDAQDQSLRWYLSLSHRSWADLQLAGGLLYAILLVGSGRKTIRMKILMRICAHVVSRETFVKVSANQQSRIGLRRSCTQKCTLKCLMDLDGRNWGLWLNNATPRKLTITIITWQLPEKAMLKKDTERMLEEWNWTMIMSWWHEIKIKWWKITMT